MSELNVSFIVIVVIHSVVTRAALYTSPIGLSVCSFDRFLA